MLAYTLKAAEESMTAASGKDVLGITKGKQANSYIVHFSDSAIVNRAVSRGVITVNGKDLPLTKENKQQLLDAGKEAERKRENAYSQYVMQHEMAVAKQQAKALAEAFNQLAAGFGIAAPKNEKKQAGVSWSQFEWKTYDTQMTVSLDESVK